MGGDSGRTAIHTLHILLDHRQLGHNAKHQHPAKGRAPQHIQRAELLAQQVWPLGQLLDQRQWLEDPRIELLYAGDLPDICTPFFALPAEMLLADDFMDTDEGVRPVLAQMTDLYAYERSSILAVQEVPRSATRQYGIVSASGYQPKLELVHGIVEKPKPEDAPSTLAVVGRYVLSGKIFSYLEKLGKGSGGEIQLTDGIAQMLLDEPVFAYEFEATRYDCGSKLGYLKASVALGLKHADVGGDFAAFLRSR